MERSRIHRSSTSALDSADGRTVDVVGAGTSAAGNEVDTEGAGGRANADDPNTKQTLEYIQSICNAR
jgi:hypothetical protein